MTKAIRKKSGASLYKRRNAFGLVFMIPWIAGFLCFFLFPFLHSIYLSFHKVAFSVSGSGGYETSFVGLENYIGALTKDEYFIQHSAASLLDLFINIPICMVFSFFVAVLLRQNFRGNFIVKAIFFLPVILGTGVFLSVQADTSAVQGMAVESAMQEGVEAVGALRSVNIVNILRDIGIPHSITEYITGPVDRIYSVISMSGVQIFIFLAGLNSISPSVYEAAYIEGASGWVAFWKITFPMVSPVIIVNVVYSLIDNFTMSTNAAMTYINSMAFSPNFNFGLAGAMSWIYCAVLAVVVGLVMWIVSKKVIYQA